jgi:acetolactate synthase-1/2/3 large subunit
MVVIVGQVGAAMRDREAFQELDYRHVFGPGTLGMAKWVAEIADADRIPEYISRAFHTALQGRPGPVVLAVPEDVMTQLTAAPVLPRVEPAAVVPVASALAAARNLLESAKRPLVLVGGSGWTPESASALERWAEHWNVPVACALRFQDTFDNRHPLYAGDAGIGIHPPLAQRIRQSDCVLALGVRLGEMTTAGYSLLEAPRPRQRLIHLHPGPEELGRVYAADVVLQASLSAMNEVFAAWGSPRDEWICPWADWTAQAAADYRQQREHPSVEPLDLAVVVKLLESQLPADTVYTNGAGNFSGWLHRYLRYRGLSHGQKTQLAPTAGSMGYGLPAAVAAWLVQPDRPVLNVAGDGDFLMNGQEMATAMATMAGMPEHIRVKPLISIVVDNGGYGTIRMHQAREYPGRVSGTALTNPDFVALAQAYGWHAEAVDHTAAFAGALQRALEAKRPALLHLRLDPDVSTSRLRLSEIEQRQAVQTPV